MAEEREDDGTVTDEEETVGNLEGDEQDEDQDQEGEDLLDTRDLSEHLPDRIDPLNIVFKAKVTKDKVVAGRKKTVKIQIIVAYDSEKIRDVNDLLGEYVTLTINKERFKEAETDIEKEALRQYQFNFGEEVGA